MISRQWSTEFRKRSKKQNFTPAVAMTAAALLGASFGWTEENFTGAQPAANQPVAVSTISTQPVEHSTATSAGIAPTDTAVSDKDLSSHPEVLVTGERGYVRERVSGTEYT